MWTDFNNGDCRVPCRLKKGTVPRMRRTGASDGAWWTRAIEREVVWQRRESLGPAPQKRGLRLPSSATRIPYFHVAIPRQSAMTSSHRPRRFCCIFMHTREFVRSVSLRCQINPFASECRGGDSGILCHEARMSVCRRAGKGGRCGMWRALSCMSESSEWRRIEPSAMPMEYFFTSSSSCS